MLLGSLLEVLSCGLQIFRPHHVATVEVLGARGHKVVLVRLLRDLRHEARCVFLLFPVDLELGNAGLFDQDVPSELLDFGLRRRRLVQLGKLVSIGVVHVVANAEELLGDVLVVVVRAGEQDGGDTNDVV